MRKLVVKEEVGDDGKTTITKQKDVSKVSSKLEVGDNMIVVPDDTPLPDEGSKIDTSSTTVTEEEGIQNKDMNEVEPNVANLFDKLNHPTILNALNKIRTPEHRYQAVAKFAELIGINSSKIGSLVRDVRDIAKTSEPQMNETVRPRIKKGDLIEHINKLNKKSI